MACDHCYHCKGKSKNIFQGFDAANWDYECCLCGDIVIKLRNSNPGWGSTPERGDSLEGEFKENCKVIELNSGMEN